MRKDVIMLLLFLACVSIASVLGIILANTDAREDKVMHIVVRIEKQPLVVLSSTHTNATLGVMAAGLGGAVVGNSLDENSVSDKPVSGYEVYFNDGRRLLTVEKHFVGQKMSYEMIRLERRRNNFDKYST